MAPKGAAMTQPQPADLLIVSGTPDNPQGSSSVIGVDDINSTEDEDAWAATRHADMRIQVVLRELNQGALAGLGSEIAEYAARLVIAALDTFDYQALQDAYAKGFRQGVAFQKFRQENTG